MLSLIGAKAMTENGQQGKYQRHDLADLCLYRMRSPTVGMLVRVMITRSGKMFKKDFVEKRHGGPEESLRLARAWRDQVVVENGPRTLKDFCSIVRSTNTSGIAGVNRRSRRYVGCDGKITRHDSWSASLPGIDGSATTKSFSVARYGDEEARAKAMEAREQALARLASAVFRPKVQPLVVTEANGITQLEASVAARRAPKAALLDEREKRKQLAASNAERRRLEALQLEAVRLAQPTNQTGIPYIGRYLTSKTHGNWRVSMEANGIRHRKTFSDSKYGGKDAALAAAITWRDEAFRNHKLPTASAILTAVRANNSSTVAGVFVIDANEACTQGYWVARSSKRKGESQRSRRFSVAKYGWWQAFDLAVKARANYVTEAASRSVGLSLAARKLLQLQI
jgi:hypothetical protein